MERIRLVPALLAGFLFVGEAIAQIAFAPAVNYPAGNSSRAVAAADFNGDGRPDLVVVDQNIGGPGRVSILLATGAPGTFGTPTGFTVNPAVNSQSIWVAVADFNGDGNPDIAVANAGNGSVSIMLGNGSGGFTGPAVIAAGNVFAVVAGDFNRDGKMDLAVTRASAGNTLILLGNGDGTFTSGATLPGTGTMTVIASGDFNGDGILDLTAVDGNNSIIHFYLGSGTGTFTSSGSMAAGAGPSDVAVGDFNGDGRADIATANQVGTVSLFRGNGDGTFTAAGSLAAAGQPRGIAAADLDRDGKVDLVVTLALSDRIDVFKGNGDGTFAAAVPFASGSNPVHNSPILVTVADLNGDGRPDIAVANATSNEVSIFFNTAAVVPNPPTAVVATPGNTQISVAFSPPTDAASLPIIDFTANCGGVTATGTSSPIVVTGLTNGTAYTCTVVARNANGISVASAPSNSATPSFRTFTGPTATGTGNATISFTGGGAPCAFAPQGSGPLQSAFFIPVTGHAKSPPAGTAPAGVAFPQGLVDFVLLNCTPGSVVSFTITYPQGLPAASQYWKYGPTTATPTPHWYLLPAAISGNVVTFSITDGGLGDDDLTANGTFVDQGGPGGPPFAQQVPTLSQWALAFLALLVLAVGAARLNPSAAARWRR